MTSSCYTAHCMNKIYSFVLLSIGSGNDLAPGGNKPLPDTMLSHISVAIYMASKSHNVQIAWAFSPTMRRRWTGRTDAGTMHFADWIIMTSSNGNVFHITGTLCREFTGHRWTPSQGPVTRSFEVFFDLRLNKRLSFDVPLSWAWTNGWVNNRNVGDLRRYRAHPLWRHCSDAFEK